MHSIRHALLLGLALIIIGFGVFLIKVMSLGYPVSPGKMTSIWDFENLS